MAVKGFKRKLADILNAVAIEYSQLMGEEEETTAPPSFTLSNLKGTCHE